MTGIRAVVDDCCDPDALRCAERAAMAITPYDVVRGSSSLARDLETTDRLVIKWRSTVVDFSSLVMEPAPGLSRKEIGTIIASIMTAARTDDTSQKEIDDLMHDLRDVACYLADGLDDGMKEGTMAYAQMRSPFASGFAMCRSPIVGSPNTITADDDLIHALMGTQTPTVLVKSAVMIKDVAVITIQSAGDMAGDVIPDALWRLRLHSRFSGSDPRR